MDTFMFVKSGEKILKHQAIYLKLKNGEWIAYAINPTFKQKLMRLLRRPVELVVDLIVLLIK